MVMRQKRFAELEARRNSRQNKRNQQEQLRRSHERQQQVVDTNYEDELENNWRQAAQMISSDDELANLEVEAAAALDDYHRDRDETSRLLLFSSRHNRPLPASMVRQQKQKHSRVRGTPSPVETRTKVGKSLQRQESTSGVRQRKSPSPIAAAPIISTTYDADYLDPNYEDQELVEIAAKQRQQDDNSDISFAQSGCHSILSAWRIKSANRKAARQQQQQQQQQRPTSVLSHASSAGRKSVASTAFTGMSRGKSPASQTRIPLGPKQAQQFVTNTRRRRRANELILSTLEARRRALAMNRQNLANSLWGSESYLAGGLEGLPLNEATGLDYEHQQNLMARLSLSPSPGSQQRLVASPSPLGRRSGSPLVMLPPTSPSRLHQPANLRTSHSDLGRSPADQMAASKQRIAIASPERRKLLMNVATSVTTKQAAKQRPSQKSKAAKSAPPIAKLDQNSSDLCTSNSSSASEDSASSSSGSQFTQLVTSELAPDCVLLDEAALKSRTQQVAATRHSRHDASQSSVRSAGQAPKAPERQKRKQQLQASSVSPTRRSQSSSRKLETTRREIEEQEEEEASLSDQGSKLRRGALKRDSIRRLRLNRNSQRAEGQAYRDQVPSSSDSSSHQQQQAAVGQTKQVSASQMSQSNTNARPRTLAPARKQLIEENPFLNRGHFRSSSMRSQQAERREFSGSPTESNANYRDQSEESRQRPPVAPRHQQQQYQQHHQQQQQRQVAPRLLAESRRTNSNEHLSPIRRHQQLQQPVGGHAASARASSRSSGVRSPATSAALRDLSEIRRDTEEVAQMVRQLKDKINEPKERVSHVTQSKEIKGQVFKNESSTVHHQNPWQMEEFRQSAGHDAQSASKPHKSSGSQSRSDLQFDKEGNRRRVDTEERWQRERLRSPDGKTQLDRRLDVTNERVELRHSSSISPPPEFSDNSYSYRQKTSPSRSSHHQQQQQQQQRQQQLQQQQQSQQPKAQTTSGSNYSTIRTSQQPQQPKASTRLVERKSTSNFATPSRRALSEERPPVRPKMATAQQQLPAELPKFERTADDEFRKRVDYLRRLARANLSEPLGTTREVHSGGGGKSTSGSSPDYQPTRKPQERPVDRRTLVTSSSLQATATKKPMTTDWKGPTPMTSAPAISTNTNFRSESPAKSPVPPEMSERLFNDRLWKTEPLSEQRGQLPLKPKSFASTNLDMLTERYQQQQRDQLYVPNTKWRRSNSSLASLTSAPPDAGRRVAPSSDHLQRRAMSPVPRSDLGAARGSHPALMKLVVREKTAPKLDYAIVEKQEEQPPPLQRQLMASSKPIEFKRPTSPATSSTTTVTPVTVRQPPIAMRPQLIQRQVQKSVEVAATMTTTATRQQQAQLRSPLRVTSPRSPDFGPMAASSNDDSAIASSVSSPSLSYTVNQQLNGSPPTQTGGRALAAPTSSSGVLQSILRRQQQQQLQHQLSSDSSDSSPMRPTGSGGPLIGLGYNQPDQSRPLSPAGPSSSGITPQQQQQQEQEQQTGASSAKRVHFNDRTSIRSFESVSSLASNSTAVPANDMLRQQVGSPDSMGSGSTSRLSGESPDMRKQESSAAIYAIRGDPELDSSSGLTTPQVSSPVQQVQHHQQLPANQSIYVPQQQQMMMQPPARLMQQPLVGIYPMGSPTQQMHSPVMSPPQPRSFIRMTAPPSISTAQNPPVSSMPMHHQMVSPQIQYLVRPTSSTSTQIIPQAQMRSPVYPSEMMSSSSSSPPDVLSPRPTMMDTNDDEDATYALRLRQAATSRVFGAYGSGLPPAVPQHQVVGAPIQQQQLPALRRSQLQQQQQQVVGMQMSPPGSQMHGQPTLQQQQQQQQVAPQQTRAKTRDDLLNYQTEV